MKIISFLNAKGGVGKTTLCVNLAAYLQLYGHSEEHESIGVMPHGSKRASPHKHTGARVLVVDADPQGSVRDWQAAAGDNPTLKVIAADRKQTLLQLKQVLREQSYDYVLIDTPGKISEIMAAAIGLSDLCVLPNQPSPYDLWGYLDAAELIKARQAIANEKPLACFVLNRIIPNTTISKEVMEHLNKSDFPILGTMNSRVAYAYTATSGKTVFDSNNEAAIQEIKELGSALKIMLEEELRETI